MSALVRAELRRLRVHALAAVGCLALAPGVETLALDPALADLVLALALLGLGAWLAHAAFPGGSPLQRHLAALPVSPRRLGAVRLGLALVVVGLAAAASGGGVWAWAGLTRGQASPAAALSATTLAAWRLAVGCGLAAWLAPWPRLGGLAWGVLALALVGLRLLEAPPALDPSQPANPLWLALAAAGACVAILRGRDAGWLTGCEQALTRVRLLDGLWRVAWSLVLAGLTLGAIPLALRERPRPEFPDPSTAIRTRHYQVVGPRSLTRRARPLIDEADALYRRVVGLLGGTQEEPDRLRVTLVDHGQAGDLVGVADGEAMARLRLAQLTAAALIADQTGRRRGLLVEGLTRYVAWRAADVDPFWSRFHLAATHASRPLSADELLTPQILAKTRGRQLEAPAGELLVALWIETQGEPALRRLLDVARATPPDQPLTPSLVAADLDPQPIFPKLLDVLEVEVVDDPRSHLQLPHLRVLEDMSDMPGLRFVAVPESDLPKGWTIEAQVTFGRQHTPTPARRAGRLRGGVHAFAHPPSRGRPSIQVGLRPLDPQPFQETLWQEWLQRR